MTKVKVNIEHLIERLQKTGWRFVALEFFEDGPVPESLTLEGVVEGEKDCMADFAEVAMETWRYDLTKRIRQEAPQFSKEALREIFVLIDAHSKRQYVCGQKDGLLQANPTHSSCVAHTPKEFKALDIKITGEIGAGRVVAPKKIKKLQCSFRMANNDGCRFYLDVMQSKLNELIEAFNRLPL